MPATCARAAQHLYLVWCGTTTNETFKWSDLRDELTDRAHAKRAREIAREEERTASTSGEVCATADGTQAVDQKKKKKKASEKIVVTMPANIYDRGFWRNLWEVLYPLSARPTDGFSQGLQAGGVMLKFPSRPAPTTTSASGGDAGAGAVPEADNDDDSVEYDEDDDDESIDSDDGRNLPAVAGKMHAD